MHRDELMDGQVAGRWTTTRRDGGSWIRPVLGIRRGRQGAQVLGCLYPHNTAN
jgi:hypothetical protein